MDSTSPVAVLSTERSAGSRRYFDWVANVARQAALALEHAHPERVEKILADLAVLRAASQLYLLGQPAVCDDLRLDDAQQPRVKAFCVRVGKEWRESLGDFGRLPPAERGRRAVERARTYEAEVNELLTPPQRLRLRQFALQAEGPGAFGEPEVVSELKLTPEQREQIRTIEEETLFAWMRGTQPGKPPGAQEKGRTIAFSRC